MLVYNLFFATPKQNSCHLNIAGGNVTDDEVQIYGQVFTVFRPFFSWGQAKKKGNALVLNINPKPPPP